MVLSRIAALFRRRPLDALQVEVTTHCLLHCSFCPHEALRSSWVSQHMPLALYERLAPSLRLARFVHLQGWGEPLLHPDLLRMIGLAKTAGCRVGLTTNGMLLDEGMSAKLLESGLDLLAVSIAGATALTHASVRIGSRLSVVASNLVALSRRKNDLKLEHPRIVLMFLMLRCNLQELPEAIDFAREVGAQELVATNLDCLVREEHYAARAFSGPDSTPAYSTAIDAARERAAGLGIAFRPYPLIEQEDVLACEAMASRTAVVSADGGVFPCVYLSLPVDPIPRFFRGERQEMPRRTLGSIAEVDLRTVWESPEYRSFRRAFELRRGLATHLSMDQMLGQEVLWDPAGSPRRDRMLRDQLEGGAPLPVQCRSCYKACGL